jgi:hypothetical protein
MHSALCHANSASTYFIACVDSDALLEWFISIFFLFFMQSCVSHGVLPNSTPKLILQSQGLSTAHSPHKLNDNFVFASCSGTQLDTFKGSGVLPLIVFFLMSFVGRCHTIMV